MNPSAHVMVDAGIWCAILGGIAETWPSVPGG